MGKWAEANQLSQAIWERLREAGGPEAGEAVLILSSFGRLVLAVDDLGRLRLNGLIERVPDTNTYILTAEGQRVARDALRDVGRLPGHAGALRGQAGRLVGDDEVERAR